MEECSVQTDNVVLKVRGKPTMKAKDVRKFKNGKSKMD